MNVMLSAWASEFVNATTQNDAGQTVTQYTGWRAILDPRAMQRYVTCDEWDLGIFADDVHHGPDQCGTDCHDPADGSRMGLFADSVLDGPERDVIAAAVAIVAEQGFQVVGSWALLPNGTFEASIIPSTS